jgi:formate dehydrogenase alpha subunit
VALLQGKKIAVVIGQGVIQQKNGSHTLGAILNLCLITGSLGCSGRFDLCLLSGQNGLPDNGVRSPVLGRWHAQHCRARIPAPAAGDRI